MKKILIVVGSLRRNSFNRQLAEIIQEMLKDRVQVSEMEYADLPFMNQDIEYPTPLSVARVRREVQEADGLWIITPEYNYQIPGVLKNALDWLSRPLVPGDAKRISALTGKPVVISSVAGGSAGAGARKNLSSLLKVLSMQLLGAEGVGVVLDSEAFRTNQLVLTEEKKAELMALAEIMLAE